MARIRQSRLAAADLLEIWVHVARDDAAAADRLLDRIDEVCTKLAAAPELGRSREELAPGLRSFPVGRHVIFYRAARGGIELVASTKRWSPIRAPSTVTSRPMRTSPSTMIMTAPPVSRPMTS
jgi:toxin ParE1/3/4